MFLFNFSYDLKIGLANFLLELYYTETNSSNHLQTYKPNRKYAKMCVNYIYPFGGVACGRASKQ